MSELKTSDFRLAFLSWHNPPRTYGEYYGQVLDCWMHVWSKLFDDHNIQHRLFSDQLMRQDEACSIFQGNRCIGMILFRTIDFAVVNYAFDSYFEHYTKEDMDKLLLHGKKAFLATYLTVHPDFRRFSRDFSFKEVLLDLMVRRFLESDADVISGITRRDRGIHDESYKLGATLIAENVAYLDNRFKVDLVAFYRHQVQASQNPKVREISEFLWRNREIVESAPKAHQKNSRAA